jgi:exosome complex component RRP41
LPSYSSPLTQSRHEIYSPEGLRTDGRRWNEIRNFDCKINTHPTSADGSSYVEWGHTKVVCTVDGPREPDNRQNTTDRAVISVNVNVASFSTETRIKRQRNDKRLAEMNILIRQLLEEAVLTKLNPRTQIAVNITVIAQDGGLLPACINAACLAMIDAGVPLTDYVSACSSGVYSNNALIDLNTLEEQDVPFLTIGVIGKSDKISMLTLETQLPMASLEPVLATSLSGAHAIQDIMDAAVRKHGKHRLERK